MKKKVKSKKKDPIPEIKLQIEVLIESVKALQMEVNNIKESVSRPPFMPPEGDPK